MTNYTKTTDFAAKDSLPSGDSGKIIRGSEFETEFDNIATAVNSKSDANNPTFTGTVTIDGLTVNGNTVLGNAATDTVTVTADIASNLIPSADDTYNLGAVGAEWNDLFIDGTANIDSLVADTADINGGTIDGVTIGGTTAGAITGTTITGSGLTVGTTNTTSLSGNEINFNRAGTSYLRQAGGGELIVTTNDGVSDKARLKLNTNGDISFYEDTGTTAKFFWDASAERLGIGTTSPSYILDLQNATGGVLARFKDSDSSHNGIVIAGDTAAGWVGNNALTTGEGIYYQNSLNAMRMYTSGSERVRIDSSGRVGIGTSSPATNLEISDSSGAELRLTNSSTALSQGSLIGALEFYSSDTSGINPSVASSVKAVASTGGGAYGELTFNTIPGATEGADATEAMRIDASGNVGIGTASPTTELHISASASTGSRLTLENTDFDLGVNDVLGAVEFKKLDASGAGAGVASSIKSLTTDLGGATALAFSTGSASGNNVEAMRIDSAGNVGIGTTSPNSIVDIRQEVTGGQARLRLFNTDQTVSTSQTALLSLSPDIQANGIEIEAVKENADFSSTANRDISMRFKTTRNNTATETMRIDSSGNVGIGTSSPTNNLDIAAASSATLSIRNTSTISSILLSNGSSANQVFSRGVNSSTGRDLAFVQGTAEAMRISSGGHLLVGKTSQDVTNDVGFEAKNDGLAVATTDGSQSLILNRKTSDGAIAEFRKDNSTVGSIGTLSSYLSIGKDDTGVLFQNGADAIMPHNVTSNASRDAGISLGTSSVRFKDLYLSGGAYLGGTAAANKLDDYEKGTWTPTLTDGTTTVTQTDKLGSYVKVGNIVSVYFQIVNASVSGLSGGVKVGGLPFTTGNTRGNGIVQFNNVVDGPEYYAQKSGSNAFLELKRSAKTTSETAGVMLASNFSEGVSDLFGSVTYII